MREPVKVKTGSKVTLCNFPIAKLVEWKTVDPKMTPKYRYTYSTLKYENEFSNRYKTDEYPQVK